MFSSLSFDSTLLLSSSTNLAQSLGHFVDIASLLLYTLKAVRLLRTKSADGRTLSTWWCKLTAFTCSEYNIRSGFPIAEFSATIVITVEALIVLLLVTYYQMQWNGFTLSLVGELIMTVITTWKVRFTTFNISSDPLYKNDQLLAITKSVSTQLFVFKP
jgi:hypothetical protein